MLRRRLQDTALLVSNRSGNRCQRALASGPRVGAMPNTVGNSAGFTDQKLAAETKLKSQGILNDVAILDARRNLEKYCQASGYSEITVSHRIQPTDRAQNSVSDK